MKGGFLLAGWAPALLGLVLTGLPGAAPGASDDAMARFARELMRQAESERAERDAELARLAEAEAEAAAEFLESAAEERGAGASGRVEPSNEGAAARLFWPGVPGLPVSVDGFSRTSDGVEQSFLEMRSDSLALSALTPVRTYRAEETRGASLAFQHWDFPNARLEVYLFPPRSFFPNLSPAILTAYLNALREKHPEGLRILNEGEFLESTALVLAGEPARRLHYRISAEGVDTPVIETMDYWLVAQGHALVLRITAPVGEFARIQTVARPFLSSLDYLRNQP